MLSKINIPIVDVDGDDFKYQGIDTVDDGGDVKKNRANNLGNNETAVENSINDNDNGSVQPENSYSYSYSTKLKEIVKKMDSDLLKGFNKKGSLRQMLSNVLLPSISIDDDVNDINDNNNGMINIRNDCNIEKTYTSDTPTNYTGAERLFDKEKGEEEEFNGDKDHNVCLHSSSTKLKTVIENMDADLLEDLKTQGSVRRMLTSIQVHSTVQDLSDGDSDDVDSRDVDIITCDENHDTENTKANGDEKKVDDRLNIAADLDDCHSDGENGVIESNDICISENRIEDDDQLANERLYIFSDGLKAMIREMDVTSFSIDVNDDDSGSGSGSDSSDDCEDGSVVKRLGCMLRLSSEYESSKVIKIPRGWGRNKKCRDENPASICEKRVRFADNAVVQHHDV